MISIQQDPKDPTKLVLTCTVTMILERTLIESLNEVVTQTIRDRAIKDLQSNRAVKKVIADAAQLKLLALLGEETPQAEGANDECR